MEKPKVLVIDDEIELCENIVIILSSRGYLVEVAYTAGEGLNKIKRTFFNLVLLDMRLPDYDGIKALDRIKELSPDTEVVILTAFADIKSVIEAMDKNAFSYIAKPFEIPQLITVLEKAYEKQRILFENRKLLQQVSDAKNDWENTFDSISDLISIHDEDFNIIKCNKALGRKFNARPEDLIGRKCYEIFHGTGKPHPACPLARCKETSKPETEEIDDPNMGGVFLISGFPRFDKEGMFIGCVEICRDITEQKESEKQERLLTDNLEKSEAKYHELFETITDGIVLVEVEGRILDCNKGYLDMLGYSMEEIRSKKYQDITPLKWHDMEEKIVRKQIMERGYSDLYEKEYIKKDGTVFPISIRVWVTKDVNDKVSGMWAIVRDITERKKIENALRESEEQFRSTFERAGVGIVHVAPNGQFLRMNKFFYDIFGYSEDEMLKLTFQDITHSDELEIDANLANQLLDGKIKTYTMGKRYLRKDGMIVWVNLIISLVHNPDGRSKYFICVAEDITERKQMEQILRESEERFRTISNTANEGIIMVDSEGNISFWNKSAERIFGYSSEEAVGKRLHDLVVPSHLKERFLEGFKRFSDTGQGPFVGRTVELTAIKKNGTEFLIEHSTSAVKMKGKWNAVGIIRDIAERKQTEGKLRISHKMASLGQMTAGIFHEILNPVNIISSHVQLLLMGAEKGSKTEEDLKSIQEEIKRIVKISDGLLRFARKGKLISEETEVNSLLEKVLSILEPDMKLENVRFIKRFEEGLPEIMANKDELRQVFLNLITNARGAMPGGGTLTVKTKRVQRSEIGVQSLEHEVRSSELGVGPPVPIRAGSEEGKESMPARPSDRSDGPVRLAAASLPKARQAGELRTQHSKLKGDFVEITFEDTGRGIARENLDKIFEPFFTTKTEGKGTGLGLSISYGIIKNHGGTISVESEKGKGTRFTIDLPC